MVNGGPDEGERAQRSHTSGIAVEKPVHAQDHDTPNSRLRSPRLKRRTSKGMGL